MAFTLLPPLPYPADALAPHISERTLDFHYGKHHAGYAANLRRLTADTEFNKLPLETIIAESGPGAVFNNAAQIWNHTFYWRSMRPDGGGDPSGPLASAISRDFGSVDAFKQRFADQAVANFGSGWTWLVYGPDGLTVVDTDDADTPLRSGLTPLLTVDIWEHAYYLDYQNARAAYVEAFVEHLLNWEFAEANFA